MVHGSLFRFEVRGTTVPMRFRELRYGRDRRCPGCGENPTGRGYLDDEGFCSAR